MWYPEGSLGPSNTAWISPVSIISSLCLSKATSKHRAQVHPSPGKAVFTVSISWIFSLLPFFWTAVTTLFLSFFLYVCGSHTCVYAHMCVSGWRPEVHIRCLWLSPDLYDSIVSLDSLPQGSCVCLLGAGIADTLPHPSSLYVGLRIQTTILMLLGPNCSFFS